MIKAFFLFNSINLWVLFFLLGVGLFLIISSDILISMRAFIGLSIGGLAIGGIWDEIDIRNSGGS